MKLPRWLVVSLISASILMSLGAGAWWWVKWPDRTAADFLALVEAGRFEETIKRESADEMSLDFDVDDDTP